MSGSVLQKHPHLIPAIIAALILLGALAPWPYGYYQLLRFVVCGVAVYVANKSVSILRQSVSNKSQFKSSSSQPHIDYEAITDSLLSENEALAVP